MNEIDTHSQFANQHPHYAGGGIRTMSTINTENEPAASPVEMVHTTNETSATNTKKTTKSKPYENPLANHLYDNVNIDLPSPNADAPSYCALDSEEPKDDNSETPTPAPPSAIDEFKDWAFGIDKNTWYVAGGIAAFILLFRNRNNKR